MQAAKGLLVAGVLAAMILAGCSGSVSDGADAGAAGGEGDTPVDEQGRPVIAENWAQIALTGDGGHDHQDPVQHQNLSTPNFNLVGYEPLVTDWHGKTTGDYFCGDTRSKDGQRLSVVHSFGSDVAFVLIDTTDPADPKKIGELVMGNTQVYDVTLTPSLDYVLLSTSPMDSGPDADDPVDDEAYSPILWRDACTGETVVVDGPEAGLPYASGIVLVDIRNPRNPTVVDFRMFPVMGGHSVRAQTVNGADLILASVPNPGPYTSYYVFMDVQQLPSGPYLNTLSVYQHQEPAQTPAGETPVDAPTAAGMHDAYMAEHPGTGQALAYLAYGSHGMVILDIDDPTNPVELSYWDDWGAVGPQAPASPYFHEALPADELWDGRHYTFLGEECVGHRPETPTCLIFTIDTTDPSDPQFVGAWTLPEDVQWTAGLQYSLHYIELVNRTLFVSNYHGGVWAIDVSTSENLRMMPSVGAYLPAEVSPKPPGETPRSLIIQQLYGSYALDHTPTVLDLDAMDNGNLVVFDGQSGLYVIEFDETYPAPSPDPWPMGYHEG